MMEWVLIRSWHIVRTFTRGGQIITLCGRRVIGDMTTAAEFPGSGRSCESCFRIREAHA